MSTDASKRDDPFKLAGLSAGSLSFAAESPWMKLLAKAEIRTPAWRALGALVAAKTAPPSPFSDFAKLYPELYVRNTEDLMRQLATRGWSLPWHFGLGTVDELVNGPPEEIDGFFEEYFEAEGFTILCKDIMADGNLKKWKVLLRQCIKNYRNGDFHICIPSLIMVLEGSFDYDAFFSEEKRRTFFKQRIQTTSDFQKLTWISLSAFCDVIFVPTNPRRKTNYINRHRVMHGLDDPSTWKKVDCLRLFQALDSTRRLKKFAKLSERRKLGAGLSEHSAARRSAP